MKKIEKRILPLVLCLCLLATGHTGITLAKYVTSITKILTLSTGFTVEVPPEFPDFDPDMPVVAGLADFGHDLGSSGSDAPNSIYKNCGGEANWEDFANANKGKYTKIVIGYWSPHYGYPGYGEVVNRAGLRIDDGVNVSAIKDSCLLDTHDHTYKDSEGNTVKFGPLESPLRAYIIGDTCYILVLDNYPHIVLSKKDYQRLGGDKDYGITHLTIHIRAYHESSGSDAVMFKGSSLVYADVRGLDPQYHGNIAGMFEGSKKLETVILGSDLGNGQCTYKNGNWSNSTVSFAEMFKDCTSLKSVTMPADLFYGTYTGYVTNEQDASNSAQQEGMIRAVSNVSSMFEGCASLETISFNGMDLRSITNMSEMFQDCSALQEVDFRNITVPEDEPSTSNIFRGCNNPTILRDDAAYALAPEPDYVLNTDDVTDMTVTENLTEEGLELRLMPNDGFILPECVFVTIGDSDYFIYTTEDGPENPEGITFAPGESTLFIDKSLLPIDGSEIILSANAEEAPVESEVLAPNYILNIGNVTNMMLTETLTEEGLQLQLTPNKGFQLPECVFLTIGDKDYFVYTTEGGPENPEGITFDQGTSILFIDKSLLPIDGSEIILSANAEEAPEETEPAEETTEPTAEPTEPAEETTEPTEEPTEPTETATEPTEEEPAEPAEAVTESTEEPTEAPAELPATEPPTEAPTTEPVQDME